MSIRDAENTFSNKQALTGVTTKTASTNVINTGTGDAVVGIWFQVLANTAITAGSSATVTVALETSTDEAFTSPITLISRTFTGTSIAAQQLVAQRVPVGVKQYLRAAYTSTVSLTGGTVTAGLYVDVDIK